MARIDRWIWAVRLAPTRSAAGDLCRSGHVSIGGRTAKPAAVVAIGDRVEIRRRGVTRTVEVLDPIEQRVGAPIAVACYVDHTPPAPPRKERVAVRERGAGRPTKRERREIDQWRGQE